MGYALGELGLRRWRTADALRLAAAHQDPAMRTQGGIVNRASAVDWIGRVADLDNGHVYAVADADDHPIGCVAVTNIDRHQVGWTWYWTLADVRGHGVARDALRALADWAHHESARSQAQRSGGAPGSRCCEGVLREAQRHGLRRGRQAV